jgi:hypothetical protein
MSSDVEPIRQTATMQPCCMAVSAETMLVSGDLSHRATRRWRALTLDRQDQLATGQFITNAGDALAIVRDKATEVAREQGYEPLKFILESGSSA